MRPENLSRATGDGIRRSQVSPAVALTLASIALWSSLASFGAHLAHLPSLLVTGVALAVGGAIGLVRWRDWRVPPATFLVGVGGIGGYHILYFTAFRLAPPVEVNLLNYLWPLLIVVLSPSILPGYRLHWNHLAGAGLGLAGAGLIVTGGAVQIDLAYLPGYACAVGAALVWAVYSLLTKRLPAYPAPAVGGFCLASGALALGVYGLEAASGGGRVLPSGSDWLYLALAGAGPLGLAFYTWSAALKRGDPRMIGALSYLTPLASTTLLMVTGGRALTPVSALAMTLIVAGAALGSIPLEGRGRRSAGY